MNFRHRSSGHVLFCSPVPTGVVDTFTEKRDENGVSFLEKTGKRDLNAFIQASLEGTLIYNILNRYALGDTGVLEKVTGFFGDLTNAPTSLADCYNRISDAEAKFNQLTPEIRALFNNSAAAFESAVLDGSIDSIVAGFVKSVPKDDLIVPENPEGGKENG